MLCQTLTISPLSLPPPQDPAGIFELVELVGNGTYGQVYKVGKPLDSWCHSRHLLCVWVYLCEDVALTLIAFNWFSVPLSFASPLVRSSAHREYCDLSQIYVQILPLYHFYHFTIIFRSPHISSL